MNNEYDYGFTYYVSHIFTPVLQDCFTLYEWILWNNALLAEHWTSSGPSKLKDIVFRLNVLFFIDWLQYSYSQNMFDGEPKKPL